MRYAAPLVLAMIVLWASIVVLPVGGRVAAVVGLGVLTAVAVYLRVAPAMHLGLFCTCATLALIVPLDVPWMLPLWVALGVYGLIVARVPRLRASFHWLEWGRFDGGIRWLVRATVLLSALALVLWYELLHPHVHELRAMIPPISVWLLPFAGLIFAVLNAGAEEAAFRGIMMQALGDTVGIGALAVVIQAVAFGFMHLHGFPRGAWGVVLASIYGLMLGFIRLRAGGLYAAWIAHVFADAVIFMIVVLLVR